MSRIGRRPQRFAQRPTAGENIATTICGTTIQAATSVVAKALERLVMMLAISGSKLALASWKTATQVAKVSSGRLVRSLHEAAAALAVGPLATPPWARTGSTSLSGIRASATRAGRTSAAVTRNTAWLDQKYP